MTPLSDLGPEAVAFPAEQQRGLELRGLIARSPLVRVVPVGATVANHGLAIQLLGLEIREAGGRAWLRFAPTDQDPLDDVRPGHPLIEVRDEDATIHEVVATVGARLGLRGEFEALIAPRPPGGVTELTLSVTGFVVPPIPPPPASQPPFVGPLDGPWEFAISL